MPLTSLAPKYSAKDHQLYADLLQRAIRHPDSRNVALTGGYGVGKSSALGLLKQPRRGRFWRPVVIELSLSTLDRVAAPEVAPNNPAERTPSNRIQKEIVKQILYRLPPGRTPRSRFARASTFPWLRAIGFALGWSVVVVPAAYVALALTGSIADLGSRMKGLGWSVRLFWWAAVAGVPLVLLLGRRAFSGRVEVRGSVKAGPATVTLQPSSSSYFDQYLDEIVYFFQVSRAKVVLIEDVDRFEDALVFDTLRALNGLLNASEQIRRRIVFVYAVRDSVLDTIDRTPIRSRDPASAALEKASRTKFFDVIIPVVPFVTADNARELMMRVMAPEETGVSPALIRLAARHVADMRLIHSIRNEFEVYKDRLMNADTPAPGISPDVVLSLVLLKVTNPVDYEAIRLKQSSLDTLHTSWRRLVNENLAAQTRELTKLRTQMDRGRSLDSRASAAGQALVKLRDSMAGWLPGYGGIVRLKGPVTEADTANPAAWRQVAAGTRQEFQLQQQGYGQQFLPLSLDVQQLSGLLGMSIAPDEWDEADLDDIATKIEKVKENIDFLRRHTWEELIERPEFTTARSKKNQDPPEISLGGLVDELPTTIARELVRHGYVTHHFARFASPFYGRDVSLAAADYIARYIEAGVPDFDYKLTAEAVGQILREQGAEEDWDDLFDDPSVYNVDIVDFLLLHRREAAGGVAKCLARWGRLERAFVNVFVTRSSQGAVLVGLMAPTWEQAVRYTTVDAPVDPKGRLKLVDAVLSALVPEERDDLDDHVATYLAANYRDLAAVTHPTGPAMAALVMGVVAASGALLESVEPLSTEARTAAKKRGVYPVTVENLTVLAPGGSIALDVLRKSEGTRPVYDHALAHLVDYLKALGQSERTRSAVEDPSEFAAILTDAANVHEPEIVGRLVDATDPGCKVPDLDSVPPTAWPILVGRDRTSPTFANVKRYIEDRGVDAELGPFLVRSAAITGADAAAVPDRLTVAVALLAAREAIPEPSRRVALAKGLEPGQVPAESIEPEDNALVSLLLDDRLVADDASTFAPRLMGSWDAFGPAVEASERFADFADPSILPARYFPRLLRSRHVSEQTKARLVARLTELLSGATVDEIADVADALADLKRELTVDQLSALRAEGLSEGRFVRLLAAQGDHLGLDEMKLLLRAMGGDYRRVAEGGVGEPKFAVDDAHWAVLSRLEGDTYTGAKVETYKTLGEKLVARLKAPGPD